MGLFVTYLAYKFGMRQAEARAATDHWIQFGDDDECVDCGHPEARHDDDGRCPRY